MNTNRYPDDINDYDEFDSIDDVRADADMEDIDDMDEGDETESMLDKYGYRHDWRYEDETLFFVPNRSLRNARSRIDYIKELKQLKRDIQDYDEFSPLSF